MGKRTFGTNPWTKPGATSAPPTKVIARPRRTAEVQAYLPEFFRGMAVTMKHFFKNTKEMVLGQRNDPTTESIDDGVKALALAEAATTSWRERRIVEL